MDEQHGRPVEPAPIEEVDPVVGRDDDDEAVRLGCAVVGERIHDR